MRAQNLTLASSVYGSHFSSNMCANVLAHLAAADGAGVTICAQAAKPPESGQAAGSAACPTPRDAFVLTGGQNLLSPYNDCIEQLRAFAAATAHAAPAPAPAPGSGDSDPSWPALPRRAPVPQVASGGLAGAAGAARTSETATRTPAAPRRTRPPARRSEPPGSLPRAGAADQAGRAGKPSALVKPGGPSARREEGGGGAREARARPGAGTSPDAAPAARAGRRTAVS
jgi:hypothetical protein